MKNRGVADIFFLVCDGLKGLPDSVSAVFPTPWCKPASST
ncbi:transposase, Mutator family protein [Mycobacterium ulcerans str. Harvey]|uniref:Transposase, Mutator family protein n=1 Tax=Mycobacterium ulcerans str. Harvey TaxID=1299332 RepID=A0ABP3ADN6_MYCUL|nr:transposase, Mutator family protein [Mycobacterium ulcerans str. Harvey]